MRILVRNLSGLCSFFFINISLVMAMESPNLQKPIADALDKKQISFSVGIHSAGKPLRENCEDLFSIEINKSTAYFAIFDGNGGATSANLAEKNLYKNFLNAYHQGLTEENIGIAFSDTNQAIFDNQKKNKDRRSGSTASVAFFSFDQNQIVLTVANIGDSPIILGGQNDRGLFAKVLTKEHRHTDEEENKRLANWTYKEEKTITPKRKHEEPPKNNSSLKNDSPPKKLCLNRVAKKLNFGSCEEEVNQELEIAPLGLGNLPIIKSLNKDKQHQNWAARTGLDLTRCFGHFHLSDKGLIVTPAITKINILPEHRFLILMTDGVSDYIKPDSAVELVTAKLNEKINLNDIAKELIITAAKAMTNRDSDNIDELKFSINDDMTVVIVELFH